MSPKIKIRPVEKFKPPVPTKELREQQLAEFPILSPREAKKKQRLLKTVKGEVLSSTPVTAYPDMDERGRPRKFGSKAKKQIPDEALDNAPSVMSEITDEILEMLDREDADGAITLTQKHLLRTVLMMLPEAERMIRASKSARGVHNFNQLVGTCREIMADIQMSRDNKFLATGINMRVIQPAMINITNMTVNTHSILKQAIAQYIPADKKVLVNTEIDNITKEIARFMQSSYAEMSVKVEQHLE